MSENCCHCSLLLSANRLTRVQLGCACLDSPTVLKGFINLTQRPSDGSGPIIIRWVARMQSMLKAGVYDTI